MSDNYYETYAGPFEGWIHPRWRYEFANYLANTNQPYRDVKIDESTIKNDVQAFSNFLVKFYEGKEISAVNPKFSQNELVFKESDGEEYVYRLIDLGNRVANLNATTINYESQPTPKTGWRVLEKKEYKVDGKGKRDSKETSFNSESEARNYFMTARTKLINDYPSGVAIKDTYTRFRYKVDNVEYVLSFK